MDQNLYFQRAIQIITKLNEVTPQAYLVGGVVRDYLLKVPFNDIDIATSATPDQILELFPNAVDEFAEYGCITVKEDDMIFEITTFREEQYGKTSRKPTEIHYSKKLQDDIKRRDYTVNALAMPKSLVLVDLVEGEKDLQRKVVRIIGKPKRRFKEDPLRILRGLNLVAKLNFSIERKTLSGMIACKKRLQEISTYKFTGELANILSLPYGKKAIKIIKKNNLFSFNKGLSNWIKLIYKKYDKLSVLEKFALLYKIEGRVPENTCFTKETINKMNSLVELTKKMEFSEMDKYDIYRYGLNDLKVADLINIVYLKKYKSQAKKLTKLETTLVIKESADIEFRSRNIVELAGTAGPFVSTIMNLIEKEIVTDLLDNKYDVIKTRVEELLPLYLNNPEPVVEEVLDNTEEIVEPIDEIVEEDIQEIFEEHEEVEQTEEVEDANISVESAIEIVETLENSESENVIFETTLDEEDEDFDILLEEYNKEFNKVLDRRLMSMIDESTTFDEIRNLKEELKVTTRLLVIKGNPKFEILFEKGLI